jgi:hypothetical protein
MNVLLKSVHVLIVFDNAWYKGNTDNINEFLRTVFYGVQNNDTPPYPNSTCDLITTVEKLDKIGHSSLLY